MPDTPDRRLERLRWRCRRGMRELDVLLMGFLDRRYASLGDEAQQAFESLLSLPDPDILDLLSGRARAQDAALRYVVEQLLATPRAAT